ncbi:MAG: polysaccharide deacetylase family protein [Bacteroidota bacterium]
MNSMDNVLLVYSKSSPPRLKYIFSLIFVELLKIEIKFTSDVEYFKGYDGPKINYSETKLGNELHFIPSALLFETAIEKQDINVFEWTGNKAFFKVDDRSAFPFDPFAAAFYLVSRYEEYLPHASDQHGRYIAEQSLAFMHGFLNKPLINIWAIKIKESMQQKHPNIAFIESKFEYINTIDIDNAYAYKGKGFVRTGGALARAFLKLDFNEFKARFDVLFRKSHDPFDTYQYIKELSAEYGAKTIYFFLVGGLSEYDRNLSINRKAYKEIITTISGYSDIGIHPSYASNNDKNTLESEIKSLSNLLNNDIKRSRQHFLKLSMPTTYQQLISLGIKEDFTMGYASQVGFRASICRPFFFYDLMNDRTTELKVVPFAAMDATLNNYLKLSPDKAQETIRMLIKETKSVDGLFISLWHNETLSEMNEWKGWSQVYLDMIKAATA